MPEQLSIRPSTNADIAAVRALVFDVLAEYGLAADPAATDADLSDLDAFYLKRGGMFDVLVDASDSICGTVGLTPLGDGRCELRKMYLAAPARGRGWGRKLLMHSLNRAAELGFRRVELETASVLTEAIGLYIATGFRLFTPAHLSPRCDQAFYLELSVQ